ncbi:hypothetical protein V2J09_001750 [Rumex salicifolius]
MGNSFGCSASGERLVSAARDGDLLEAKMLLEFNPCLAKYSTFGGLNSPLHFAAAKGHNEGFHVSPFITILNLVGDQIVTLLLENGADVNSRNYCGQTALMQACRYGHWEVVQTLLLFRCNVTRADYLTGRTALHFAAVNGHVRCIRLVLADFVPSASLDSLTAQDADGGITALHMASLNGYFDCVQLLIDLQANVSAVTFHYGTSMDLVEVRTCILQRLIKMKILEIIGAGSTPLHYAACGGNLKCCQILIAKGASRLSLNCNGWLPVDVAKMWGRHWLEPLLAINSEATIPTFPHSKYLSLPLMSVLDIARDTGLVPSSSSNDYDTCAVCLERACSVAAAGCRHQLCVKCALYLCSSNNIPYEAVGPPGSIPCPLCRHGILSFIKLPVSQEREIKLPSSLSFCTPCMLHPRDSSTPATTTSPAEIGKNRVASVSPDLFCPVSCSPFPSVTMMPLCNCSDGPCPPFEPRDPEREDGSQSTLDDRYKTEGPRLERTSCSGMFWGRRSCSREHQCNSEINAG